MNDIGLSNLVRGVVDVQVWADFVPEKKPFPAVAYIHIANLPATRLLGGNRDSNSDTWRLSIITENYDDRDIILGQLKTLDNSFSNDFKNVFIISETNEPADPNLEVIRAFIDLKTVDRGL